MILPGLVVDLFAGGGGASTGMERALMRPIDIAINHDAEALAMHRANHPHTRHLCENIRRVCPRIATGGLPVDVLWGSPDCKHFSRAKGGKPMDRAIRSLAWVIIRWAEETLPWIICVENVPEFRTWGPLGRDDRPIKAHAGDYFRAWVRRLKRLGYRVEWRELVACDYGAPTSRRRFFVVARRDGRPIAWPEATHGPGREQPWRTAAECIEWADPAPSIFDRKKPLAEKTQARIAKGIKRYVLQAAKPFIVVNTSGHAPTDLAKPMPTVTTGKQHMIVGPTLVNLTHGARLEDVHSPVRTVTGAHRGEKALVAPSVIGIDQQGARSANWPADAPLSTIVAKGKHAVVAASIAKHYGGVVGQPVDKPLGTVTAVDHNALVSASMVKLRGTNVGGPAEAPLQTISAQGQHHGLLCAHIERYYSLGGQLSDVHAPLPTATAKARFGLSTAMLDQYNTRSEPQPMDEPMPSVVSRDRLALVDMPVRDLEFDMDKAAGGHYVQTRAFLRRWGVIGPTDEAEVVIEGVRFRIVDIGMRMLRPRELYRAQGFPESYVIAPVHKGKPLTLTSQVRMCGNSVPPDFAEGLVRENFVEPWTAGELEAA